MNCPFCKAALRLLDTKVQPTEDEYTILAVETWRCGGLGLPTPLHDPLVLQRSERVTVFREDEAAQHGILLPVQP